jgi:hypothetical protein
MDEKELISKAMAALGSRTSEAKAAAVKRNGAATRFQAKPLAEIPCDCVAGNDAPDSAHRATCPRGRAYRRRQKATAK